MQLYERARLLANPVPVPPAVAARASTTKGLLCNNVRKERPVEPRFLVRLCEIEDLSRVAILIQQPGGGFATAIVNLSKIRNDREGRFLELFDKPRGWKKVGYGNSTNLSIEAVRAIICVNNSFEIGVTLGKNGTAVRRFLEICDRVA